MKIYPLCKKTYKNYPALSRKDNKTEICPDCGFKEALKEFSVFLRKEKKN